MCLRIRTVLFHKKCVPHALKYTEFSYGFTSFSDEKSLIRLSCHIAVFFPLWKYTSQGKYSILCITGANSLMSLCNRLNTAATITVAGLHGSGDSILHHHSPGIRIDNLNEQFFLANAAVE